jgi:hypothetical protein
MLDQFRSNELMFGADCVTPQFRFTSLIGRREKQQNLFWAVQLWGQSECGELNNRDAI